MIMALLSKYKWRPLSGKKLGNNVTAIENSQAAPVPNATKVSIVAVLFNRFLTAR